MKFKIYNSINNNNNNNKNYNNNTIIKKSIFNRLIGLPVNNDKISLNKFKLKRIKYISLFITILLITIFFTIFGFYSRTTIITTQYQNQTNLPEIIFKFNNNDTNNIQSITYQKTNGYNYMNTILKKNYINGEYIIDENEPDEISYCTNDSIQNDLIIFQTLDNCISLNNGETIFITFFIVNQTNSPMGIEISINNNIYKIDSSSNSINALEKLIYINSKGEKNINFKNSMTITRPRVFYYNEDYPESQDNYFGFFYFSNIILTETVQTNSLVFIGILSNVGSSIVIIIIVFEILFIQITKLKFIDKSAWILDETRDCIIYHSDQINLNNLNLDNNEDDSQIDDFEDIIESQEDKEEEEINNNLL